jgi:acetolactate synthase-1/2/3 large subunit
MIIAGIEAVHGGMGEDIKKLAELLCAPVLTDSGGKGIIPEDHPLSFGNATNGGVVKKIHNACDVTLAVGSRLRYVDFKRRGISLPGLIHVDWDRAWIDKNFKSEIELIGDVKEITAVLAKRFEDFRIPNQRKHTVEKLQEEHREFIRDISREKEEVAYVDALRDAIPDNGSLVIDNTILGYFAEQLYPSKKALGLVPAKGASPIGFAFPAALGLKIANPEEPVVALIGDGGFLYGGQELATCMQNGIGFPVIVVNDKAYRMIDYLQHNYYQAGYQTTLLNPDFTIYAEAFGVQAVSVNSPDGLNKALKEALASKKMWLIELNAAFPAPPFGKY